MKTMMAVVVVVVVVVVGVVIVVGGGGGGGVVVVVVVDIVDIVDGYCGPNGEQYNLFQPFPQHLPGTYPALKVFPG